MRILTGFIIYTLLTSGVYSQNLLDEQYEYASTVFYQKKYFDAVTEFKRLMYFDKAGIFKTKSNFFTGISYKKGGFYGEAIKYLTDASLQMQDPDSIYNTKIEIIKCNILRRTGFRAMALIKEINRQTGDDNTKKRELEVLRGFAAAFSDNWDTAARHFSNASYDSLRIISEEAEGNWYSETKAKILSAIIPGAGQFYTGNYLNGVVSLLINSAAIYLTVDAFIDERAFDGIMTGNFLWLRFYTGNISNAGKFARENNERISESALRRMQETESYTLH